MSNYLSKIMDLQTFIKKQTFAINLFQKKMSFTSETSTIEKDVR